MQFRSVLGLAALFVVSFSVGCSLTNPTVRGQGPDVSGPSNSGPIVGSAPGYGEFKRKPYIGNSGNHDFRVTHGFRNNNFGYGNGYYTGPNDVLPGQVPPYTAGDGSGCPDCNSGQNCPQNGCRRCGRGCGNGHGIPQHYQTYQHNWPKNMVYPQQGAPSGVVQYPYYTLRGPTDFFMDKAQ